MSTRRSPHGEAVDDLRRSVERELFEGPAEVQPLHAPPGPSQVLSWVRDPAWTHKPADPPGCVE